MCWCSNENNTSTGPVSSARQRRGHCPGNCRAVQRGHGQAFVRPTGEGILSRRCTGASKSMAARSCERRCGFIIDRTARTYCAEMKRHREMQRAHFAIVERKLVRMTRRDQFKLGLNLRLARASLSGMGPPAGVSRNFRIFSCQDPVCFQWLTCCVQTGVRWKRH
jgi:hypothetical protein